MISTALVLAMYLRSKIIKLVLRYCFHRVLKKGPPHILLLILYLGVLPQFNKAKNSLPITKAVRKNPSNTTFDQRTTKAMRSRSSVKKQQNGSRRRVILATKASIVQTRIFKAAANSAGLLTKQNWMRSLERIGLIQKRNDVKQKEQTSVSKQPALDQHSTPSIGKRIDISFKNNRSKLLYAALSLMFINGCIAQCESGQRFGEQIIFREECQPTGITIFKQSSGHLCSYLTDCRKNDLVDEHGSCQSSCRYCPPNYDCIWPIELTALPEKNISTIMKQYRPKHVCAFETKDRNKDCADKAINRTFSRIILRDGTSAFVESLNLRIENTQEESFTCVYQNNSGFTKFQPWLDLPTGKEISGTLEFCNQTNCTPNATIYCFRRHLHRTFYTWHDTDIPVVAWSHEEKSVYGYGNQLSKCDSCSLKCSATGVILQTGQTEDSIQVKVTAMDNYTLVDQNVNVSMVNRSLPINVIISPENLMIQTMTIATFWHQGSVVRSMTQLCKPRDICHYVNCLFCKVALGNPQCFSSWLWLLICLILLTVFSCVCLLLEYIIKRKHPDFNLEVRIVQLIQNFLNNARHRIQNITPMLTTYRHQRRRQLHLDDSLSTRHERIELRTIQQEQDDTTQPEVAENTTRPSTDWVMEFNKPPYNLRKSSSSSRFYVNILILSLISSISMACTEEPHMIAADSVCQTKDEELNCSISTTVRFNLNVHAESCLILMDEDNHVLGRITVSLIRASTTCNKNSLYWTRQIMMNVASIKRCASKGSCHNDVCEKLSTKEQIYELRQYHSALSRSYCMESCGCITCGCGLCASGCLFYTTFPTATTSAVFEIFNCPSWIVQYHLRMTMNLNNVVTVEDIILSNTENQGGKQVKLSLISSSQTTLPILQSTFITDGTRTAAVKVAPAGSPVPSEIGNLQCPDHSAAESNLSTCHLVDDCKCSSRETSASCSCSEVNIDHVFKQQQSRLPLITGPVTLSKQGESITADHKQDVNIEVQLNLDRYQIVHMVKEENSCTVQSNDLQGSFNSLIGATAVLTCVSSHSDTLGHATCGSNAFMLKCQPEGITQYVTLHFDYRVVNQKCTITCASTTSFWVKGTLAYVPSTVYNTQQSINSIHAATPTTDNFDWNTIAGAITGNVWSTTLKTCICVIVAFLGAWVTVVILKNIVSIISSSHIVLIALITATVVIQAAESRPINYNRGWKRKEITWFVDSTGAKTLDHETIRSITKDAALRWMEVANIVLREVEHAREADIKISFVPGNHADTSRFGGKGGVLGHAHYPTDGRIHLDQDELWDNNDIIPSQYESTYTYLPQVMQHEIGHALGLHHSQSPSDTMYKYYKRRKPKLSKEDIVAIQSIYGKKTQPRADKQTKTRTSSLWQLIGNIENGSRQKMQIFVTYPPSETTMRPTRLIIDFDSEDDRSRTNWNTIHYVVRKDKLIRKVSNAAPSELLFNEGKIYFEQSFI